MADVRCPMCGKPNPADLEVCQFCQARLKPLRMSSPQEDQASSPREPVKPEGASEEVPEWLLSLRGPENAEQALPAQEEGTPDFGDQLPAEDEDLGPEADADIPDWLSGLRDRAPEDEGAPEMEEDDGSGMDWDLAPDRPEEAGQPEEEGLPDWLTSMRSGVGLDEGEEQEIEPASPAEEEPEWLLRLREHQDEGEDESLAPSEPALSEEKASEVFSFTDNEPDEQPEDESVDAFSRDSALEDIDLSDMPDWLSQEDEEDLPESESISSEGLSEEWPSGLSDQDILEEEGPEEAEIEQTEEIPDWLAEIGKESREPSGVQPFDDIPPAEEIPEWLDKIEQEQDQAAGAPVSPDLASEERIEGPEQAGAVGPFAEEERGEEQAEDASDEEPTEPYEQEPAEEAVPDWLAEFGEEAEQEPEAEELPEWLAEAGATAAGLALQAEEEPASDLSQEEVDLTEADEEVDLQELLTQPEELEPTLDEDLLVEDALGEADLEWLEEIGSESSDALEEEGALDFTSEEEPVAPFAIDEEDAAGLEPLAEGELPEWLSEVAPKKEFPEEGELEDISFEEAGLELEEQLEEAKPDLAEADLPSWVEAMRPVAASAADMPQVEENNNLIESIGPLAGLRGVLPAEPDVSQAKKPRAYSLKLQITDAQKANAALLEQLVKTEGVPRAIPSRPAISSQHILRLLIAFILIFTVVWPLVTGGPQVQLPAFSPEAAVTSQLITALQPDTPVLMAVDYEPGWSGEMDAVAAPVVDHLMLKGAYLTLVSTTPSGPAQAEHLVDTVKQHEELQLNNSEQFTNLGFIPGGPAGLLSFAQSPQQVLPVAQDGSPAWESGPLANVKSLADFGMVFVVTENPQTARAWIEQVRPSLGDTPLVMVISAQAEPLVRPYYDAYPQQVQGMVTGLMGGVAYENLTGRAGTAGSYWNAFSLGLVVAGLLILAGGVFNAASAMIARSKENAEGEG